MKGGFKDPLRAALLQRGAFSGVKGLSRFVPVSLEERDQLIRRLERDDKDMVCESCGSTKPLDFYKANGAISCCTDRKMVASNQLLEELRTYRGLPQAAGLIKRIRAYQRTDAAYGRALASCQADRIAKTSGANTVAKSKLFSTVTEAQGRSR